MINKQHNGKRKLFVTVFIGLLMMFTPLIEGKAETELKFHVQPQFPESQVEGNSSYFDINLEEGKTELLKLTISNSSEKEIEIRVTPHTAFTNVNGIVEYGKDQDKNDPSLTHKLNELMKAPDSFKLQAGESKDIEVTLQMPTEKFDGLLAGGLRIEEVLSEGKDKEEEADELTIKNTFSYVVGVVVSTNRSAVKPELELIDVFADQLNYRNVFSATIQNYTPTFVNQLEVEASIYLKGSDEVLYESKTSGMQMAPNSNFNYPIPLEGEGFRNGTYLAKVKARSGENEWSWEQEFVIDRETANRLNREDVTVDSSINWWMVVGIVLFILILVLLVLFLLYRKKNKDK